MCLKTQIPDKAERNRSILEMFFQNRDLELAKNTLSAYKLGTYENNASNKTMHKKARRPMGFRQSMRRDRISRNCGKDLQLKPLMNTHER